MDISIYEKDEVVIFRLTGCVISPGNEKMLETVKKKLPDITTPPKLVFDFKDVSRIDCAGLGILMKISAEIRPHGGRIALINVRRHIRYLIVLTRLYTCLECYSSEKDALDCLQ